MSHSSKRVGESLFSAAKRKLLDDDDFVCKNKQSSRSYVDNEESCSAKIRKRKKEKKSKKKKSKKKRSRSSSESASSSEGSDTWVEKAVKVEEPEEMNREDWMSMTGTFATFSRKDLNPEKIKEKKTKGQIDAYNPSQCSRELNPYWKNGGTGLPSNDRSESSSKQDRSHRSERDKHINRDTWSKSSHFKKPDCDDDYKNNRRERRHNENDNKNSYHEIKRNWKKLPESDEKTNRSKSPSLQREERKGHREQRQKPLTDYEDTDPHTSSLQDSIKLIKETQETCFYLTDQQMNALGARIVKAEILGNTALIAELTRKLDAARIYKKLHPKGPPDGPKQEDGIMLTMTDDRGNTRPLTKAQQVGDPRSKGGKKKATTHSEAGDRMKFFADDDKHSLKEMFEKEKFGNAEENDKQFVQIISKHKNPNDDLEDIFAESITKNKSEAKRDEDNMRKAIHQHKKTQRSLDNCDYCVDSDRMLKHMIVSLGSKAYVALPTRKSLTEGHCFISTVGHVACSTTVDEDVWTEILDVPELSIECVDSCELPKLDGKRVVDIHQFFSQINQIYSHKSIFGYTGTNIEYVKELLVDLAGTQMDKHLSKSGQSTLEFAILCRKMTLAMSLRIRGNGTLKMIDDSAVPSYRRALTSMFSSRDEDVVFFETATYFHKHPHMVIHCVPLPRDVGDTAPIYFKKALLECEAEWSNNKKVVDLRGRDIRRGVPKGLPYFWIDFGMDAGFAHVIEDQQLFPMNFAQEIVGGMLDLDHSLWRKPQKENFENQRKKILQFTTEWKKFDPEASS